MVIKGLEFLNKVGKMAKQPAMELIKKSPLPNRWKKYLQGETLGEAKIKHMAKGNRSTVPYEISAFVKGGGTTLSLAAIYNYLTSEKKQSMRKMAEATGITSTPKSKPKKKVSNVGKNTPMGTGIRSIKIKKGDNLTKLANKYNTSVMTLKKLNPKVQPRKMEVGSTLRIPTTGGRK